MSSTWDMEAAIQNQMEANRASPVEAVTATSPKYSCPPGYVAACIYGCCWKLPGQTWDQAIKKGYTALPVTPEDE